MDRNSRIPQQNKGLKDLKKNELKDLNLDLRGKN
jgi:hypothetical protein